MENPQAVTQPNASPVAGAEGASDAPGDLDSLLNEYEEGTTDQKKVEQAYSQDDLKRVLSYLKTKEENEIRDQVQKDVDSATETINEGLKDMPIKVSSKIIRGLLREAAESDPRFLRAWQQRNNNKAGWTKVLTAMQKEIRDGFEIDTQATDNRRQVVSAVRGASTAAPRSNEAPDYNKLSDREFQKVLSELGL